MVPMAAEEEMACRSTAHNSRMGRSLVCRESALLRLLRLLRLWCSPGYYRHSHSCSYGHSWTSRSSARIATYSSCNSRSPNSSSCNSRSPTYSSCPTSHHGFTRGTCRQWSPQSTRSRKEVPGHCPCGSTLIGNQPCSQDTRAGREKALSRIHKLRKHNCGNIKLPANSSSISHGLGHEWPCIPRPATLSLSRFSRNSSSRNVRSRCYHHCKRW